MTSRHARSCHVLLDGEHNVIFVTTYLAKLPSGYLHLLNGFFNNWATNLSNNQEYSTYTRKKITLRHIHIVNCGRDIDVENIVYVYQIWKIIFTTVSAVGHILPRRLTNNELVIRSMTMMRTRKLHPLLFYFFLIREAIKPHRDFNYLLSIANSVLFFLLNIDFCYLFLFYIQTYFFYS